MCMSTKTLYTFVIYTCSCGHGHACPIAGKTIKMPCLILFILYFILIRMDLSPIRQNFEKIQNRQKFHNSLKEHPMFSKIAKFGCEMLETVENIALRS